MTVPSGRRATVTLTQTSSVARTLALRVLEGCPTTSCASSLSTTALTAQTLTVDNATSAPRTVYLGVSAGDMVTADATFTLGWATTATLPYVVAPITGACDDMTGGTTVTMTSTTSDDTFSAIAALLVALPAEPAGERHRALLLGAVLIAVTNLPRRPLTALPTDVIELQRAWAWRAQLPRGARVFFVARAENYVLGLPIHDGGGRGLRTSSLDITDAPPDLRAFGPGTWYYRSSLCAAPPAQAWCDALERAHHLQPTFTAEIPAAPSMRHLTYATPRVRIGLYRVTD
jgi:hypothetical protein